MLMSGRTVRSLRRADAWLTVKMGLRMVIIVGYLWVFAAVVNSLWIRRGQRELNEENRREKYTVIQLHVHTHKGKKLDWED